MDSALYGQFIVITLIALAVPALLAWLAKRCAPSRDDHVKLLPYECGVPPVTHARHRFSVKFYLVAVLFVLFDVEVAFLFPWAVVFRETTGLSLLIGMVVFLLILFLGLVYVIRRGALEWE
jgi:NADH-quinone oxidoreductase subunit A